MMPRLRVHGGVLLLQYVSLHGMALSEARGQNCLSFSSLNTLPLFNRDAEFRHTLVMVEGTVPYRNKELVKYLN
jgi:hypothetical protein